MPYKTIDGNLFDTEEKKQNAILQLSALQATEGWGILVQILEANVQVYENQILNPIAKLSEDQEKELKWKRHFQEKLITLPDIMRKKLAKESPKEGIDFDPYA